MSSPYVRLMGNNSDGEPTSAIVTYVRLIQSMDKNDQLKTKAF